MQVLKNLLPDKVTNNFTGHKAALYVFPIIALVTIVRSLIHILAIDGGAQSIAGITLDQFSEAAASTVVAIFAMWGISQLLFGLLYGVIYVKYKSLIPLMYLFMLTEYLMRLGVGFTKTIQTTHTPPGVIGNYILVPILIILIYLSLQSEKKS